MICQRSCELDIHSEWLDADWWQKKIANIISLADPIICNLRITQAHYRLSRLLLNFTGEDSGANFHTWAVWGSKKAGETIRQEDTRRVRRITELVSGACGVGLIAVGALGAPRSRAVALIAVGCLVGVGPPLVLRRVLGHTGREVLEGNRTVLEDIGNVTARFIARFHDRPLDQEDLDRFLQTLRPGPTEAGGQSLLSRAFLYYYQASFEQNLDKKHEQIFLANCYAILHEHIRLEPYIHRAMPLLFRRLITARLLRFYVGAASLDVGVDVPSENNQIFPETLRELDNPELIAFLHGMGGWDRSPNDLNASQANNWANLNERMNFIVDLFRSRHLSPNIFATPFTEEQEAELSTGRMPRGPF